MIQEILIREQRAHRLSTTNQQQAVWIIYKAAAKFGTDTFICMSLILFCLHWLIRLSCHYLSVKWNNVDSDLIMCLRASSEFLKSFVGDEARRQHVIERDESPGARLKSFTPVTVEMFFFVFLGSETCQITFNFSISCCTWKCRKVNHDQFGGETQIN